MGGSSGKGSSPSGSAWGGGVDGGRDGAFGTFVTDVEAAPGSSSSNTGSAVAGSSMAERGGSGTTMTY
jgi:hypothetical protein